MKRTLACALRAGAIVAGAFAFSASAQDEDAEPAPTGVETGALEPATPVEQADAAEAEMGEAVTRDAALGDDAAVIDRVNAYLNGLDTAQARFVQIGPDGAIAEGDLYIHRPGRARFEYDAPHPSIVVADGREVAHQDRDLETIDRVPLRSTPLHFVLRRRVDIGDDAEIVDIDRRPGEVAVTARDPEGEVEGELTLVFATPVLELREWIVLDALGQQTIITLSGLTRGGEFDDDMFELEDDRRPSRRRNR